jgi:hypothetical protein
MKNYKDFISSRVIESEPEVVIEQSQGPEILELEDLPNLLGEEPYHNDPMDPPNVLIMRRKSVRQYPNGQRVALYFVDKINKYVTVPYTAMQWSSSGPAVAEELEQTIIDRLTEAADSSSATKLKFEDGTSLFIGNIAAKQMLKLHESLNKEHKKEFVEIANRSRKDFLDIQDFAKQS